MDWKHLAASTLVKPGSTVDLTRDFNPAHKEPGLSKDEGRAALESGKSALFDYQDRFYAQADRALLVVLQAIDAAGKDGTIKHVMSGLNPEGVDVYSFKVPSATERAHDYLWRHQLVAPALGRIAVFNRSHYENVTVTRIHPELLWPKTLAAEKVDSKTVSPEHAEFWHRRYQQINAWEHHLVDNGTTIVKLFLNVSRDEQGRRFLDRIDRPEKNWKFSPSDLSERKRWDDYQEAFSDMLSHTSTPHAPWHVIPADRKWFSHVSTFAVLLETMKLLDPRYPDVADDVKAHLADAKVVLESELGHR